MVFLPENFDYIGTSVQETKDLAYAETDQYIDRYRQIARELKIWLSLGGFHEKVSDIFHFSESKRIRSLFRIRPEVEDREIRI